MAPTQPSGSANSGSASTPPSVGLPPTDPRPDGYEVQEYQSGSGFFGSLSETLQRWQLAEGVTMRPAGNIPHTNARSYEHPELKQMIDGSTAAQVNELGEMWVGLGNDIMNFGASLERTATSSEAIWEGKAGRAARNMLSGLAQWSQNTGQGVQYMGTTMRVQAEAADQAKTNMPDPVPYSPAVYQEQINSTINPFEWWQILGDAREQADRHNAAHEEAIRVTETYSTALHGTNGAMPAFTPPPEFGSGDTGLTPGTPTPGGAGGGAGGAGGGAGGAGGGSGGSGGGGVSPGPGEWTPPSTPGQVAPSVPGPGVPGPGVPVLPPGVGPGGGGATGVPGYLPAAGLGGAGAGGRGPTIGGGRAGGGDGFGPRGSGSNPLGRGGFGATDAAERVAGAGGAGKAVGGTAGRGLGAGGFPMAGAGRGQGAEDTEHRRPSYLMETEDIWGDGRKVAPPVIGEDPPEYYR